MITLKDIAAKTGINKGSISCVLNNHPKAMELKAETRERIRLCAREMGYFRNEMAHSIATSRGKGIAFIAADMGQAAYTGKIQEEEDAAPLHSDDSLVEVGGTDTVEAFTSALRGAKSGWKVAAEGGKIVSSGPAPAVPAARVAACARVVHLAVQLGAWSFCR